MRFKVDTDNFRKALEKVNRITTAKRSAKYASIGVRKTGYDVHIVGGNSHQFIDVSIDSNTDDIAIFEFSNTKDILKAMKFFECSEIEFDCNESEVIMSCADKKIAQTICHGNQVELPAIGDICERFSYTAKKLEDRFNAVKYAVSSDKNHPIFTGICFSKSDMVATDGRRLALNRDESVSIFAPFIVPCDALKIATGVISGSIIVETDKEYMRIIDEKTTFIARLLGNTYIDYSQLISSCQDNPIAVDVEVDEFKRGLQFLATFESSGDKAPIYWRDGRLGTHNNKGRFECGLDVESDMSIGILFDGRYMLEALGQFSDRAIVSMNTPLSPMLITSEDDKSDIALILPCRA